MNLTSLEKQEEELCVCLWCVCVCVCVERESGCRGIGSLSIEASKFNSTMQASRLQTEGLIDCR